MFKFFKPKAEQIRLKLQEKYPEILEELNTVYGDFSKFEYMEYVEYDMAGDIQYKCDKLKYLSHESPYNKKIIEKCKYAFLKSLSSDISDSAFASFYDIVCHAHYRFICKYIQLECLCKLLNKELEKDNTSIDTLVYLKARIVKTIPIVLVQMSEEYKEAVVIRDAVNKKYEEIHKFLKEQPYEFKCLYNEFIKNIDTGIYAYNKDVGSLLKDVNHYNLIRVKLNEV